MCGLDQDQPARIKPKRVETMAMKPAVRTTAIGRYHANQRVGFRQTAENCGDETERRGGRAFCFRHDFMQPAAGEAARRQVGIEDDKAERQRSAEPFHARQQAAQFADDDSAIASDRKWRWSSHLVISWRCISVYMFAVRSRQCILEHNKNIAKVKAVPGCA